MRSKKVKLSALLLLVLGLTGLYAQEAIPATGGNVSGTVGSVSYSVGQVVYTVNTGTNGSIAQGVQQPYEISVVTGVKDVREISLSISAFPNPTTDFLTLLVDNFDISNLSYQLFNNTGELIKTKKVAGSQTNIITANLVPAAYFLNIIQNNKKIKTFRIIKN